MGISRVPEPDELLWKAHRALGRHPGRAAALALDAASSAGLRVLASAGWWRPCMTHVEVVTEARHVLAALARRNGKVRRFRRALGLALDLHRPERVEAAAVVEALVGLERALVHLDEIRDQLDTRRSGPTRSGRAA